MIAGTVVAVFVTQLAESVQSGLGYVSGLAGARDVRLHECLTRAAILLIIYSV